MIQLINEYINMNSSFVTCWIENQQVCLTEADKITIDTTNQEVYIIESYYEAVRTAWLSVNPIPEDLILEVEVHNSISDWQWKTTSSIHESKGEGDGMRSSRKSEAVKVFAFSVSANVQHAVTYEGDVPRKRNALNEWVFKHYPKVNLSQMAEDLWVEENLEGILAREFIVPEVQKDTVYYGDDDDYVNNDIEQFIPTMNEIVGDEANEYNNGAFGPGVVMAESVSTEGVAKITQLDVVKIGPADFTKQALFKSLPIQSWIDKGYIFHEEPNKLFIPKEEKDVTHMVTSSSVLKFNEDFNVPLPGNVGLYQAGNPMAKGEYDKPNRLGKIDTQPLLTGRGLCIRLRKSGLDYNDVFLSKHYTPTEYNNSLAEAKDNFLNNIKGDEAFDYSATQVVVAKNGIDTQDIPNCSEYATIVAFINKPIEEWTKEQKGLLINMTNKAEKAFVNVFSFDYSEYGVTMHESFRLRIAGIHNANRNKLAQILGSMAKAAGTVFGQYTEFIILGWAYKAEYKNDNPEYKEGSLFVNYLHNKATGLPVGIVILCKPVAITPWHKGNPDPIGGKAGGANRLKKLLGAKKPSATPDVVVAAAAPVAKDFVMVPLAPATAFPSTNNVIGTSSSGSGSGISMKGNRGGKAPATINNDNGNDLFSEWDEKTDGGNNIVKEI